MYKGLDAGYLNKVKALKEDLKCKPFNYFLEHVAPDMLENFPYNDALVFASGAIQSEADKKYCVDSMNRPMGEPLGLYPCNENLQNPGYSQEFVLKWHRNIRKKDKAYFCLDADNVSMLKCHFGFGNQLWQYLPVSIFEQ